MKCALDFCDREASLIGRESRLDLCKVHYNQEWRGTELKPIGVYVKATITTTGRTCTLCDQFKTYDQFYVRTTGKPQSRCKDCMIRLASAAQAARKAANTNKEMTNDNDRD